jgi:tRNA 5-methylaminomethyl-2-thiouridine biosynthesis bifunctional protein
MLHHVVIDSGPLASQALDTARRHPILAPLAQQLSDACWGLSPGFHRLEFEEARVVLTLCIGQTTDLLKELQLQADSVWLGAAPPLNHLKAIARLCRHDTLLHWPQPPHDAVKALNELGFKPAIAPGGAHLTALYQPGWTPRRQPPLISPWTQERRCVIVGSGLAGVGTALALARRGWQVSILDAAPRPAQGASGLLAGLFSPHVSGDDGRISRLTRTGLRLTRQAAQRLLQAGVDWSPSGVLEHRIHGKAGPPSSTAQAEAWSQEASAEQKAAAGLAADAPATWHRFAGWIRPARLVQAMLDSPEAQGIQWLGGCLVDHLQREGPDWRLLNAQGHCLAQAPLVVVAAGAGSPALARPAVPLQAIRGQLSWGATPSQAVMPPFPVNGQGALIPGLPSEEGSAWYAGSTFDRHHPAQTPGLATALKDEDHQINLSKLAKLLPGAGRSLHNAQVNGWAGVRCTSPDRLPLVGPVDPDNSPGVWLCTALGTRGLTWGLLCADALASHLCGDPLPVPLSQARALLAHRPAPGKGASIGLIQYEFNLDTSD